MSVPQADPFTTDLYVDGKCFRVPHAVAAHVKFLEDLASRYAEKLAKRPAEAPVFGRRGG